MALIVFGTIWEYLEVILWGKDISEKGWWTINKTSLNSIVGKLHLPKEIVIRALKKELEELKDNKVARKSVAEGSVRWKGGEQASIYPGITKNIQTGRGGTGQRIMSLLCSHKLDSGQFQHSTNLSPLGAHFRIKPLW